jgi:hypothetical protein
MEPAVTTTSSESSPSVCPKISEISDPDLARLVYLVLPFETELSEYDVVAPGMGAQILRMCSGELAHQRSLGVENPVEAGHKSLVGDMDRVMNRLTLHLFVHRQE